jgi:hypothetical protein
MVVRAGDRQELQVNLRRSGDQLLRGGFAGYTKGINSLVLLL